MDKNGFFEELAAGKVLVSDGATGTNLQKWGLPVGAAAEAWVLENPDAIQKLNRAFIDAGSDILLTCTFGATRMRLAASNLSDQIIAINRQAVKITRETVDNADILIGGSIGPTGHMLAPMGTVTENEAESDFKEQAQILCEEGVDLIVIETQFDLNEASAAVRGVRSVDTSIPLICSFSYDRGTRTMMGVKPEDVVKIIGAMDVDILGINCGRSLEENLEVLKQLSGLTDKPIWFKPNAGMPTTDEQGMPAYSVSPEGMGLLVPQWVGAGAGIVGGCCGTSPEHLAAIAVAALS